MTDSPPPLPTLHVHGMLFGKSRTVSSALTAVEVVRVDKPNGAVGLARRAHQGLLGCECDKNATPETRGRGSGQQCPQQATCRAAFLGSAVGAGRAGQGALCLVGGLPHCPHWLCGPTCDRGPDSCLCLTGLSDTVAGSGVAAGAQSRLGQANSQPPGQIPGVSAPTPVPSSRGF